MFLNVAGIIFILTAYLTLFRNFIFNKKFHKQFDSKSFIFLQLARCQFPCMSSKFGGMCRPTETDSSDNSLSNSCQNFLVDKFFAQKYLAFSSK